MRVCLIGDFSPNLDEGLKNIAYNLFDNLSQITTVDLIKINIVNVISMHCIKRIKKFHPDIIHYIPGPTNKSALLIKAIIAYLGYKPKIVLSASYPYFDDIFFKLIRFKPDYVFSSSSNFKNRLDRLGINSELLPNGVDTEKFKPVSERSKNELRYKYKLDKDKITLLHVGHIKSNRNLGIFKRLSHDYQVIIVGSTYIEVDKKIVNDLLNAGCNLFCGYIPNIEEFYQLSDCYIFPVILGNSILCPLSVMEAMSCNLSVLTKPFEGIQTFFREGNGLLYLNSEEDFADQIKKVTQISDINTRDKVDKYSWKNIADHIVKIYYDLGC